MVIMSATSLFAAMRFSLDGRTYDRFVVITWKTAVERTGPSFATNSRPRSTWRRRTKLEAFPDTRTVPSRDHRSPGSSDHDPARAVAGHRRPYGTGGLDRPLRVDAIVSRKSAVATRVVWGFGAPISGSRDTADQCPPSGARPTAT